MNAKTDIIIDAATAVFARYGFSKTTMGDIATEAGVSRQTVYNAFASKEDVLRATLRKFGAQSVNDVTAMWVDADSFVAKIDLFHTYVPIKWFDITNSSPEWADLMEGMHKAAAEEVKALDDLWRAALTIIFAAELSDDAPRSAADLVDFFYNASLNAKHGATDVDHLRKRLDTVKAATLALMG